MKGTIQRDGLGVLPLYLSNGHDFEYTPEVCWRSPLRNDGEKRLYSDYCLLWNPPYFQGGYVELWMLPVSCDAPRPMCQKDCRFFGADCQETITPLPDL